MTRRAVAAARIAIVALALVLATGVAAPAGAATDLPAPIRRGACRDAREARQPRPARRPDREPPHRHPYRWGGASPGAGFDCSGLVQYVYAKVGIHLPHYAAGQYGRGHRVSRSSLRAGDLVFFSGLGHVGIYAGDGMFIHAPRSGTTVRWSRLSSHGSYYGATRLFAA